jgi:hypothetical protein
MSGEGRPDGREQAVGCLTIVFIAFAIFAFARGCTDNSSDSGFAYPRSVLDHQVSVSNGNTELAITLKLKGRDAGYEDLDFALIEMENILKHEQRQSSGEDSIVFHIVGDTGGGYDDYGKPRQTHLIPVFDIRYTMEDIKRISWEHLPSPSRLLNIGLVSGISDAGTSVAQSYCQKEREWTQVFCENF